MKRRSFIQQTSLAGASLALPWSCSSKSQNSQSKNKLGVALVGLGYYSQGLLAPALQLTEACELRGIVTGSPEKIPIWQEKYGIPDANVYNYENMASIANNDDIDVIYIVLPNKLHTPYAVLAADAGKQVWCEKPMSKTVADCQKIMDACQRNKVQLTIGYRMQHEPNTQQLMRWAKERPFGKIKTIKAEAGFRFGSTRENWRLNHDMGGGALYDMGVYCLNATRYVTGEEPIAVTGRTETSRPEMFSEVDETTIWTMEFPGGTMAECKTSFGMGMNELDVQCIDGSYRLSPFQSYTGVSGSASDGTILAAFQGNQQARQMDDDAKAIVEKKAPMVPGEEGLRDIRIVEAIFESIAKGGQRIEVT